MDPDATPSLVILAGQSNMVGYKTSRDDLAPKWHHPIANTVIWQNGRFEPLRVEGGYQRKGFGPELSFAHSVNPSAQEPLALVKLAKTATYLATDWSPDNQGGLFDQLVDSTRAAMMDRTVRLAALLWMQGEADSIDQQHAEAYSANLEQFLTAFRRAIGAPDLPVIAGMVNPPLDACPHAPIVQRALRQCALSHVYTIDCDNLPKRRDNLHYTAKGLSILGRRFAAQLDQLDTNRNLQTRWLWRSPQYHVWQQGPDLAQPEQLVSMPFATKDTGFTEPGFGQSYFAKNAINTTYIRANDSNWFQDDEIFDLARRIRARLPKGTKPVIYGASMGAYGALLLSRALDARKVIAVAPQYSIDRAQVPSEVRWKRAARKIGPFRHRLEDHTNPDARTIVLFDPMSLDRNQVAKLPRDDGWEMVRLPFTSHQVLQSLLEIRALPVLLGDVFGSGPDVATLKSMRRAKRRSSKIYWMSLADNATPRRPALARYALDNAQSCGAPPRKIRRLREALDDS